jgi:hypothetical protein
MKYLVLLLLLIGCGKTDQELIQDAFHELHSYCKVKRPNGNFTFIATNLRIDYACDSDWNFGVIYVSDLPVFMRIVKPLPVIEN